MALLSYEMIQEIRGVADAYERTELKRIERANSDSSPAASDRPATTRRGVDRRRG